MASEDQDAAIDINTAAATKDQGEKMQANI
jgi:hypothetical protein